MPYFDLADYDQYTHLVQLFLAAHPARREVNEAIRAQEGKPWVHRLPHGACPRRSSTAPAHRAEHGDATLAHPLCPRVGTRRYRRGLDHSRCHRTPRCHGGGSGVWPWGSGQGQTAHCLVAGAARRCAANTRYLDTGCEGHYCRYTMHRNSVQQSVSSWWVAGKFVEGSTKVPRLQARPWLGYQSMIMHRSTTAAPKASSHSLACFAAHFGQLASRPKRRGLKICQHLLHCTMAVAFPIQHSLCMALSAAPRVVLMVQQE